jgi:tryptophan synthase alpha chain
MSAPSTRITAAFQTRQTLGQMAFIPFVTAGDPDLASAGADLIEVGFPYSDPIADGPVIQSSYTRALQQKIKLKEIFAAVTSVSREVSTPLLAMVSYALIFRTDPAEFVRQAAAAGFCGLIVPDLPGDEAGEFAALTAQAGLALVQLVAPTTPAERLAGILKHASGFVYCIAVAGTTGAREAMPVDLTQMLNQLRHQTKLPLAVGFGVSRPEQIRDLRGRADGAIVGSALVKCLDPGQQTKIDLPAAIAQVQHLGTTLATAAHGG